jgi:hypothetical protein
MERQLVIGASATFVAGGDAPRVERTVGHARVGGADPAPLPLDDGRTWSAGALRKGVMPPAHASWANGGGEDRVRLRRGVRRAGGADAPCGARCEDDTWCRQRSRSPRALCRHLRLLGEPSSRSWAAAFRLAPPPPDEEQQPSGEDDQRGALRQQAAKSGPVRRSRARVRQSRDDWRR